MDIEKLRTTVMELGDLEAEKNQREEIVLKLRGEMREIRKLLEPHYIARNQQAMSAKTTVLKVGN